MGVYLGRKKICSLVQDDFLLNEDSSYYKIGRNALLEMYKGTRIGECRLIADPQVGDIVDYGKFRVVDGVYVLNISETESFDGWVLCDGKKFSKSDFPRAWEIYRTNISDSWFSVPLMKNFVRMNPGTRKMNSYGQVGYSHPIPEHSHVITSSGEGGSVDFKSSLSVVLSKRHSDTTATQTVDGQELPILCPGYPNGKTYLDFSGYSTPQKVSPYSMDIDVPYSLMFGSGTNYRGADNEAYPIHNNVSMMVYIGGSFSEV